MAEFKIEARPWQPQDLIDDLQLMIDEEPDNYLNGRRTTLCMARDYLREFFFAGAVPVVRCKDCIHYLQMDGTVDLGLCRAGYTGAKADGFCSYGERRADHESSEN